MEEEPRPRQGKTTIAPEVLITLAKLSTLGVPGVVRMGSVPGGVNRLFKRGAADGVQIQVENNTVTASLHIIVKADTNVCEIGRAVQNEVARAIHEMVGMKVAAVNVIIDDVEYEEATA